MEGLKNELWRRWSEGKVGEWAELIVIVIAELSLQPFRHFTYITTHSPTLPSLYLRHSSFSNPSVASPTSQLILQSSFRFSYVTTSSLVHLSRAHSPIFPSLHLRHSSFSSPSFASPTSQSLHSIHLASRPWKEPLWRASIPGIYRITRPQYLPNSRYIIAPTVRFERNENQVNYVKKKATMIIVVHISPTNIVWYWQLWGDWFAFWCKMFCCQVCS